MTNHTLAHMMMPTAGAGLTLAATGLYLTFAAVVLGHVLGQANLERWLLKTVPAPVQGLAFGAALSLALVLTPGTTKAFIYFQF